MIGAILANWRTALILALVVTLVAFGAMARRGGRVECEAKQAAREAKAETRQVEAQENLTHDAIRRDNELATRQRKIGAALAGAHEGVDDAGADIDALFARYDADVRRVRDDATAAHTAAVADYRASIDP